MQDLTNGVSTVNIKQIEKDLGNKKILKWVLESLGVKKQEKEKDDSIN